MIRTWLEVLCTCNLPDGKRMDPVSKWLIVTRSFSFYISLTSVAIGGLLAALAGFFHPMRWILVALGMILAQAANNMINDLFDTLQGIDTEDYPRLQYAPHPLQHGLVGRGVLVAAIVLCCLSGAAIALVLTLHSGWAVMAFVAAGILMSFLYVAPPFKLKQRGLGEITHLIAWGPVVIGGTYYVMAGAVPLKVWLASIPYGIAVATGLMAKYVDKSDRDLTRWVLTLPVLLGEERARHLTQLLVWAFYLLVTGLVFAGDLPWPALLVLVSLPRAVRFLAALHTPWPGRVHEALSLAGDVIPEYIKTRLHGAESLESSAVWPYWYTAWGDWWKRLVGVLFVLGLLFGLVINLLINLF